MTIEHMQKRRGFWYYIRRVPRAALAAQIANEQTPELFAAEAETVAAASPPLTWRRPSDHDADRALVAEGTVDPANETAEVVIAPNAGRLRGIVLHKLMEELLNGELSEDETTATARADVLLQQIAGAEPDATRKLPIPSEMAKTALRTLRVPEIAALRPGLIPELAVWSESDGALIAGRTDAAAYDGDTPSVVVEWKSDIAPSPQDRAQYRGQLQEYMRAIGAPRGAVVYMSLGVVAWV